MPRWTLPPAASVQPALGSGLQITDNLTGIAVLGAGTNPLISGAAVRRNRTGIQVLNSAHPIVFNNLIAGNALGVENVSAPQVDARVNYWGAQNGPSAVGTGSGDKVSSNVLFVPFLVNYGPGHQPLLSLSPESGGNTGPVTITVIGSNFSQGATAKLSRAGYADIAATSVGVNAGGLWLNASFDLTGKALGAWTLTVTNSLGDSISAADAFTIQPGCGGGSILRSGGERFIADFAAAIV